MDADTIAAIATPVGAGGIGIVKISGSGAISSAVSLLRPLRDLSELKSHHLYHGYVIDPETGKTVDEVLYTVMRAPNTYTREDVVEIQAHGSRCGLHRILELVLRQGVQGVRLAEPGEFTKRAFVNGRIDLTQAEAVVEVICAQTKEGLDLATRQLKGQLHEAVEAIRKPIETLLVEVEAAIDFPEDLEEIIQPEAFSQQMVQEAIMPLEELLAHYDEGHIYREGISAIIVGRPNVGKSSLMNRLLDKERSIVTTIPGTTRDFIEETVNIKGIPLRLIDTAGLHDTDDAIEVMGIRFTRERLDVADIVLFMVDCSTPLTEEDTSIYDLFQDRKAILVINKRDLKPYVPVEQIVERFPGPPWIQISALYNQGIEELKAAVFMAVTDQRGPAELPATVPNIRHKLAIDRAVIASKAAAEGFRTGLPGELVAIDLKDALDSLGEITGVTTTEDILDQIFTRFCIGK
jgi:tRNA modification GTPase